MCMKACKSVWSLTTPKYSASCSECLYTTWWLSTVNCEWEYCSAVSLILLCWVLAILEPYGLRLKHVVMSYYYPERARQRAAWLYNNILRSRGGFLKFIRRQLRRKFGKSKDGVIDKISLMDRLRAKWVQFFGFWRNSFLFGILLGSCAFIRPTSSKNTNITDTDMSYILFSHIQTMSKENNLIMKNCIVTRKFITHTRYLHPVGHFERCSLENEVHITMSYESTLVAILNHCQEAL